MNNFLKRTMFGVLLGNFVFTILVILNILTGSSATTTNFINNFIPFALISMGIGVGFSAPSVIYDDSIFPQFSFFRKVLIQLGFGFGFAYLGVCWMLQISNSSNSLGSTEYLVSTVMTVFIGILVWFFTYKSFKKESEKINKKLEDIQTLEDIPSTQEDNSPKKEPWYWKIYNIVLSICYILCFISLIRIIIENLGNLIISFVTIIFLIIAILSLILRFLDEIEKK
ncbi:MAG: DUF3021 domain-containing protein [Methanobrevibacter sp. CfCl-M3]